MKLRLQSRNQFPDSNVAILAVMVTLLFGFVACDDTPYIQPKGDPNPPVIAVVPNPPADALLGLQSATDEEINVMGAYGAFFYQKVVVQNAPDQFRYLSSGWVSKEDLGTPVEAKASSGAKSSQFARVVLFLTYAEQKYRLVFHAKKSGSGRKKGEEILVEQKHFEGNWSIKDGQLVLSDLGFLASIDQRADSIDKNTAFVRFSDDESKLPWFSGKGILMSVVHREEGIYNLTSPLEL